MTRGIISGQDLSGFNFENYNNDSAQDLPSFIFKNHEPELDAIQATTFPCHSPIRNLPEEIKSRIIELRTVKQSATALFAALYNATSEHGYRNQNGCMFTVFDMVRSRYTPGVPVTVEDMARRIAQSPDPNATRDQISAPVKQPHATIHPGVDLKNTQAFKFGNLILDKPFDYQKHQAPILLNTNYELLRKIGEVSVDEEKEILNYLKAQILTKKNPFYSIGYNNSRLPSNLDSAIADAMLLGLTARLIHLKNGLKPVISLVDHLVKDNYPNIHHVKQRSLYGASLNAQHQAIVDLLNAFNLLKEKPDQQYCRLLIWFFFE